MTFREAWSILDKKDAEEIKEDDQQRKKKRKITPSEIIEITYINQHLHVIPLFPK